MRTKVSRLHQPKIGAEVVRDEGQGKQMDVVVWKTPKQVHLPAGSGGHRASFNTFGKMVLNTQKHT